MVRLKQFGMPEDIKNLEGLNSTMVRLKLISSIVALGLAISLNSTMVRLKRQ